jgi:two-component system response regulator YcbB
MVNFFIIDDNINIIKVLENIIEESDLGTIVGTSTDSLEALTAVYDERPDIILIDLLMPNLDGINFVKKIEDLNSEIIMISQVSEKKIIGRAYEAGVKFFISKPINKIEVIKVIENVIKNLKNIEKLNSIVSILGNQNKVNINHDISFEKNINYILNDIGISGEKGSDEIVKICLKIKNEDLDDYLISDMYAIFENSTAVKQRIRRALSKGLANIAALGVEDYMNVKFTRYSSNLYDFQNIKLEMDHIRKKSDKGGKINVTSFINNLIIMAERID